MIRNHLALVFSLFIGGVSFFIATHIIKERTFSLPRLSSPLHLKLNQDLPGNTSVVGFSGKETFGRWTDGQKARLSIPYNIIGDVVVEITGYAFPSNQGKVNLVKVGAAAQEMVFTDKMASIKKQYTVKTPSNLIEIDVNSPSSPFKMGVSADKRVLGIAISEIKIIPQLGTY